MNRVHPYDVGGYQKNPSENNSNQISNQLNQHAIQDPKNSSTYNILDHEFINKLSFKNEEYVMQSPQNKQQNERQFQIDEIKEHAHQNNQSIAISQNNVQSCRICLLSVQEDESKHFGQLMNICNCKGSIQYVHFFCQKDMLEIRNGKTLKQIKQAAENIQNNTNSNQNHGNRKKRKRFKGIQLQKCDLCNVEYQVQWKSKLISRPYIHMKTKKRCLLYTFIASLICFLLFLFALLYLSLQSFSTKLYYSLIQYTTFDYLDTFLTILNSEIEMTLYSFFAILQIQLIDPSFILIIFLAFLMYFSMRTNISKFEFRQLASNGIPYNFNSHQIHIRIWMIHYIYFENQFFNLINRVQYHNSDDIGESIFSFVGYMLVSFGFFCNSIVLLMSTFKLFWVRIYFVESIQKAKQKDSQQ